MPTQQSGYQHFILAPQMGLEEINDLHAEFRIFLHLSSAHGKGNVFQMPKELAYCLTCWTGVIGSVVQNGPLPPMFLHLGSFQYGPPVGSLVLILFPKLVWPAIFGSENRSQLAGPNWPQHWQECFFRLLFPILTAAAPFLHGGRLTAAAPSLHGGRLTFLITFRVPSRLGLS